MRLEGIDHLPWAAWRLVVKKVATLQELETHWSFEDVIAANDVLDAIEEATAPKG